LSEPEAGDATSQKTTAIDKGSLFVKRYKKLITNGSTASTYLVIAQTDVEKDIRVSMLL
jgi:alkylation response protein AidB-like acyl-CoA dehydrogenase